MGLGYIYLDALGDGAIGGEAAGDGRAADGAEAGLGEGAAGLDARPGHDADEAEVVRAAVELAPDRPPRVRQADAARHALALRGRRRLHPGLALALARRRRPSWPCTEEKTLLAQIGRAHV